MQLTEWLKIYLKHRDAFTKNIVEIRKEGDGLVCVYKDKTVLASASEMLEVPSDATSLVATLQRKENIDFLLDHWKEFVRNENLTILFVNPERNEKWIVKPALHDRIAGEELHAGIYSMAESVTFA